jgi:hypothetical protein
MPNGGHRSRRDVTLTTQVVSLAALVDPVCSGAKIAACAHNHRTINERAAHPKNHESQNWIAAVRDVNALVVHFGHYAARLRPHGIYPLIEQIPAN